MGTGHALRCLTLAGELKARGWETIFLCREHPGHVLALLEGGGHEVRVIQAGVESPPDPAGPPHAAWLRGHWKADADRATALLGPAGVDWLVVDHYALDQRWETQLRPLARRILAIDDLADRDHDCDVLLDQNLRLDQGGGYDARVSPQARRLLGPRFALLRPEFRATRAALARGAHPPRTVLVFLGGADPDNYTALVLEALASLGRPELDWQIVVGPANPNRASLRADWEDHPQATFHDSTPAMAGLMASADFAVVAGGTVTWERLCLGLPGLAMAVAANQEGLLIAAERAGLLVHAGRARELSPALLASAIARLLDDPGRLAGIAGAGMLAVDGLGCERVARAMALASLPSDLVLRPAQARDVDLIFSWANLPETRAVSLHPESIPYADHCQWFANRLASPYCQIHLLESAGVPAGQIRFDHDPGRAQAEISFFLSGELRGRGLGRALLLLGIDRLEAGLERPIRVLATVKTGNEASARAFRGAGFALEGKDLASGVECLRFGIDLAPDVGRDPEHREREATA